MPRKLSEREKEKGVWFTIVTHDESCRETIKQVAKEFPFYAYIDHRPDKVTEESDNHFHTHVVIQANGSRSIAQIADKFQIPSNYVQKVRRTRSMLRYLVHADDPDKIQYDPSEVITNKPSRFKLSLIDNSDDDVRRLFEDLHKLQRGILTCPQFIELHYMELQRMPFYQKINTLTLIEKLSCAKTT